MIAYNRINMVGKKLGRLKVIRAAPTKSKRAYWYCKCDCGKYFIAQWQKLRRKIARSCGCLHHELCSRGVRFKHGHSKTHPLYQIWMAMRKRCNNLHDADYKNYGGRGIKVCKRWDSFPLFIKDMGYRPRNRSLDRIDNDKGYSPANCRWATSLQQAKNRRPKSK